ncbi:conjugal transfer ATPase TcpF [Streptococcus pneumoniae]
MKKIRSYTSIWSVEKVLYSINDFRLPFPITFTQMTWFVVSLFAVMILGNLPPLSMIEGAFLKYFGIPVAFTWFMSTKTFDGKKPYGFLKSVIAYALRPKLTYAGKKVTLGRNQPQEAITEQLGVNFMAYPIKYIENNLVWNKDGECYAYYELVPYNYSFLSPEQKIQVHDSFRQLIAQNRDGKIHALQISTESSIRSAQERSKNEVTGKLKAVAYDKIDQQTDALISMIGENQVNYRFFIGFKLLLNDQEFSMKSLTVEAKNALSDFVYDVNHKLMGDFVSMSNDEILRFQKMEKLLENKISRRFKIRRLDKDDFGYLIEHLYGQTGTAYEEYEYHLSKKKLDNETLIKYYDLIKPTRCLVEEKQRYLKIQQEDETVYVAYFTINSIVGELDFPSSEIFYYQQQQFTFPIDTSMNVEIVANRKALSTVRNKKKELKDLDNHAWQSDNETSSNVAEALESVNELETNLDQSKESMYKLSYVVRVSANDLDELKRRCNEVKDFYDDLSVKLVRPFGDMLGLHEEFLPASKRYMNDYIQYVTSDFLAGLGFGATQMLGENEGIYVGYSLDTGRNVYLKPALASQGVKGSVTNALASAFVGSLGGGKSFANNLIVYYAVLYGAQAVIVDPKAERGRWKETLPEISHEINIVTLTSDEKNKGLLDPYVIMKNPKDSESLAIDILTFLTGISSRDGERFPILRKAIRAVTNSEVRGLMKVIEELRVENTPLSTSIADHIESFTDYDFAHLLFSNGYVEQSISLEKQLNIIQVADLVLPDKETSFEEYTTMELLSVAMLIVISTFALDFIHTDRSIFKIVDLDEAWSFLQVAQGKTLSMKLVRAGRAMNAGVYFVTQNTDDLLDEKLKNNLGLKFAFRSTDLNEIKKTLAFFGVDPEDENNQKRLRDLENGQCLISDLYGRVGVIQFHPVFEELLHAFDTRPPVRKEV